MKEHHRPDPSISFCCRLDRYLRKFLLFPFFEAVVRPLLCQATGPRTVSAILTRHLVHDLRSFDALDLLLHIINPTSKSLDNAVAAMMIHANTVH